MTDIPVPDLKARARAAYERSIGNSADPTETPDPETLARMERALLALPRITREVFLANRLDHYSYAKIADITGLSVRQVKRQMVKALMQLGRYHRGDERTAWQRFWQSLFAWCRR